ncbi:MAG TPA: hypothetical protein VFL56_04630, partial [Solirubrobacterales bacterium]|nr:hypothetical protein [Solirubrobacterales bacterium]
MRPGARDRRRAGASSPSQDPNDLDQVHLYWWQGAFLMVVAVPLPNSRTARTLDPGPASGR